MCSVNQKGEQKRRKLACSKLERSLPVWDPGLLSTGQQQREAYPQKNILKATMKDRALEGASQYSQSEKAGLSRASDTPQRP